MIQRNCRICNKFFSPRWKKQLQCSTACSVEASKRGLPKVRDGKPPRKRVRMVRQNRQSEELRKKYKNHPEILAAFESSPELRSLALSQMVDDRNPMQAAEFSGVIHMSALQEDVNWQATKIFR